MRRLRIAAALGACLVAVGLLATATLRVNTFDATIELDADGVLHVTERIAVTFYTDHHGIDREIPVSYRAPTGANTTIDLDLVGVTLNGGPVPYTSRRVGRELRLRIGDPDRTIRGAYVYSIAYTVDRAWLFHDDYLQLYWNVTGNAWRIPIDRASATVLLPAGVGSADVSTTSYVGYEGSPARGGPAAATEESVLFSAASLSPGEGLTIDIAIPRDLLPLAPPTFVEMAVWFLNANKFAALPILVLIGMILLWARLGRDPRKGTIAPQFEPPRGMHPGEAGVLIDDRADLRDISAMLIGLAVKGQLRIEEVDVEANLIDRAKELLGRPSASDYRFVRRDESADGLSAVEQLLLETIFDAANPEERTLFSLENEFYKSLPNIKSRLYGSLIEAGYYPRNPEQTRRSYTTLGLIAAAGGVAIGVVSDSLYLAFVLGLCGLIVLAFARIMPRKTRKGVRALEEVLGMAEYIQRAEVDRIEFHDAPEKSPQVFERLLPYAIALNLTSIWTKQFADLMKEPPQWYGGRTTAFHPHLFALSMLHLTSGMERTFVSAPRSTGGGRSAWSGGSSFGGGFSGGGFGGGGGGGW
ncbi:DUF2207 domain-containing protein [Candidatus Bipolaricaulota bacterium]|nr:DUF2207 domain-containing protein [Candidatus Bipolaricaulota bacterium]